MIADLDTPSRGLIRLDPPCNDSRRCQSLCRLRSGNKARAAIRRRRRNLGYVNKLWGAERPDELAQCFRFAFFFACTSIV